MLLKRLWDFCPEPHQTETSFCLLTGKIDLKGLLQDLTKALVVQLRFFVKNFLKAAMLLSF
jgi:hypothetical protein